MCVIGLQSLTVSLCVCLVDMPLTGTTVPLLMPLLMLMERPAVAFEGMELWESNDQGCEILLRHLEEARNVAHNADSYTANTERVLQGTLHAHR